MIEFVLAYLNNIVGQLGYFTSINGLADKLRVEDKEFPAVFAGKEYNAIELDHANGISYWRKNGEVRIVNLVDDDAPSCATYQDRVYPLRMVYMVPKPILQCEDAYTCDNIAETLCNNLAFNNSKTLAANLNAENVSVIATSFNTSAEEVWDEEFKGVDYNLPTDMCFVAINFEVTVRAQLSCFTNWTCSTVVVITPEQTIVYENGTTNAGNCGDDGTFGLFKDKTGNVLNFYSLAAGSDNVSFAYNEETCALEITVTGGDSFTCEDVADCEVITDMQTDISDLQSDLSSETSARQSADTTLQNNIDAENAAMLAATTNSAILAKLLTGLNISGSSITSTDDLLTAFGKLQSQINGVLGGAIYQGTWAASTNSPTLANGVGTKGYYYVASDNGSVNFGAGAIDFNTGDWAIYNGAIWQKVDNTDAVSSVNGQIGAVNLTSANISEVTNLYFTTARVLATALTGYVSGAGTVAASDTILQAINKLNGNIAAIVSCTDVNMGAVINAATNYPTPLNADKIGIWDSANSLFKSLTLTNLKAVTPYTLQGFANANLAPADSTTYYYGLRTALGWTTTQGISRIYIPRAGTITSCYISFQQNTGASGETSTISIRLNNSGDSVISSSIVNNSPTGTAYFNNTALNIPVIAGDYIEIKWATPAWATNPINVTSYAIIYIS